MELYRGKSKRTGDWIIGSVVCIGERAFVLVTPYLEAERPAYNGIAMGCGLEDRELTKNGYQAAEYGWEEALKWYEENFPIWEELEPETVTRCCGKCDKLGNVLFEGDVLVDGAGMMLEICYGKYLTRMARGHVEHVGFFAVTKWYKNDEPYKVLPIGATEKYGELAGNIFDNPEMIQYPDQEAGQEAGQPPLMPAT